MIAVPLSEVPGRVATLAWRRPAVGMGGRHRVRFRDNRVALAGVPARAAGQGPMNRVAVLPRRGDQDVVVPTTGGRHAQVGA